MAVGDAVPYGTKMAPVQGAINKTVTGVKIAPVQGAINKTVTGVKIAPVQGSINKKVFIGGGIYGDVDGNGTS